MARGGREAALPDQRPKLRPLQDLRYQGSKPEHRLGGAGGRWRAELFRHVSGQAQPQAQPVREGGEMPTDKLHPDAQRVCEMIIASGRPPIETLTPLEARAVYLASKPILQPDPEPVAEVTDLAAEGPGGPIPLRLYRARPAEAARPQPVVVYLHGGGWVIGDLESHDQLCRALANAVPCSVIAVHYRLAPEHKFPAAAEDAIAATRWIAANADRLKVDAKRLAVAGDSAGGNLSAVVAIAARDSGQGQPVFQFLIYPGTDMAMQSASIARHAEQLPLTRKGMQWFLNHYLNGPQDVNDWRASPL